MRDKGKGFFTGLALLCMLAFVACGAEEKEPECGYLSSFVTVPDKVFKGVRNYAMAQEGIYTVGENNPVVRWYDFQTGETEKLFTLPGEERILRVGIGKNGQERRLLLSVLCYGTDNSGNTNWDDHNCFLRCYTVEGQLCWESAIEEDLSEHTNCRLFMAEDGSVYMSTDTGFYVFSAEGKQLGWAEYQGESRKGYFASDVLACDEAGGAYVTQLTKSSVDMADKQYTIYCWEEDTQTMEETARVNGKEPVQLAEGNGFYFKDYNFVYQYNLRTEEMTPVFSLTDHLIDSNYVGRILRTENGWKIGKGDDIPSDSDMQIYTLEWGILPDRERLVLAAVNTVSFHQQIASFNQQHPEYLLTMRRYEWDNTPDGQDQIQLSLLGKDAPDLVEIMGADTYRNYAGRGYLLDLSLYLEASGISAEDYVPSVWAAMQIENQIYSLPEQFYISTIAVPESAVGGKEGWTIEEFLDFMEEHPNAYFVLRGEEMALSDQAQRKGLLLSVALTRGVEGFVDAGEGRVDLDNERFRSLLTRINALQIDESAGLSQGDLEKRIRDGEILMCETTLGDVSAICQLEREHGQPMALIGYPAARREESGGVLHVSSPLGISSKSEHRDAAWRFLEETALQENDVNRRRFPASQEKLQKLMDEAQKTGDANFEGAFDEEGHTDGNTLPRRHADMIWNAIHSSAAADPVTRRLRLIIQEEASYYFAGEKTLDEVIDLMESRAGLYFQENRP